MGNETFYWDGLTRRIIVPVACLNIVIEVNGYETRQMSSLPLPCKKRNSCLLRTEELTNRNIVYERKTKDCAGSWTFQHKSRHLCLLLFFYRAS